MREMGQGACTGDGRCNGPTWEWEHDIIQKDRQNWSPAMPPIRVTFDTNAYSPVTRPQLSKIITTGWPLTAARLLSKKRRVAWWYIKWCIRHGRIRAAIPEAAFAAEANMTLQIDDAFIREWHPKYDLTEDDEPEYQRSSIRLLGQRARFQRRHFWPYGSGKKPSA
jgi:hypothetical protein